MQGENKMKTLLKKLSTLLFAVAVFFGMISTAAAEAHTTEAEVPSKNDKETVTISNLEEDTTIKIYQIVKPVYVGENEDEGIEKYELVIKDSIADTKSFNPTSDEITALALKAGGELKETSHTGSLDDDGTYTITDLPVGEYLVIAEPADGSSVVYNPMVVSVFYTTKDGKTVVSGSELDASSNWTLTTKDAFAKKTVPETEKKIDDNSDEDAKGEKGDDHDLKEYVSFFVSTMIPSYSAEYDEVSFKVTDELDAGLDYLVGACEGNDHKEPEGGHKLVVKVGGKEIDLEDDKIVKSLTETEGAGGGFVLEFTSDYLKSLASSNDQQRTVEIAYDAKLNENCKTNLDLNKNKVTVEYTNKPGEDGGTHKEEKETYHYTFEIDGKAFGESEENNKDVYKSGEEETSSTFHKYGLDGAEFTLYTDAECTKELMTTTTKEAGQMNFKGLDEGKYYLKETKAPSGYSLNTAVTEVEISASFYDADDPTKGVKKGMLKDYTISFKDLSDPSHTSSKTYEAAYKNDGSLDKENINIHNDDEGFEIKDTKTPELPSTGGAGTYALTIVGVAVFVAAAYMAFKERKA